MPLGQLLCQLPLYLACKPEQQAVCMRAAMRHFHLNFNFAGELIRVHETCVSYSGHMAVSMRSMVIAM